MHSDREHLVEAVRRAHDAQDREADSLDTKTGLVLGFAGLLLSTTPRGIWSPLALPARLGALAAAALSLRVLVVRLPDAALSRSLPGRLTTATSHRREVALQRKWWRVRAAVALLIAVLVTIGLGTSIAAVLEGRGP